MNVAVIYGGRSSEHEISLESGASVAEGLRQAGHEVTEVLIERDGRWLAEGEEVQMRATGGLLDADVAFPVLHGPFGEDGTVQGTLEILDVAYAGPSVLAAAVAKPLWVKPSRLGSSVGISRVSNPERDLDEAVEVAQRHDPRVIVEANAGGREVECSVIGNAR